MQIHEITKAAVKEGILSGLATVARDAFTRGAFRYGAAQTGVNLAPYFAEPESQDVVRIKDAQGVTHNYTKSGSKWYENNKEVDPATATMIDNYAKQKASTSSKSIAPGPETSSTSGTPSAPAAEPTPVVSGPAKVGPGVKSQMTVAPSKVSFDTNLAKVEPTKKRTGGKVAGKLSQTPNAVRKRAARLAGKTSTADAGTNAMGQMARQLSQQRKISSTGGTITQTPTGLMHTAKPAPKKTVAAKVAKKTPAKNPTWKGRGKNLSKQAQDYIAAINAKQPQSVAENKYSDLEKILSQALAAQGHTK